MIRRDLPEVLEIENLCFPQPWQEHHFVDVLRQRNVIGSVCETPKVKGRGDDVVGYAIYELNKRNLFLHSMAVHPSCWRRGIGTAMMSRLLGKLSLDRRTEMIVFTSAANCRSHLFLKSLGFRCTQIIEDDYEFHFDLLDWHDDVSRARQTDGRA